MAFGQLFGMGRQEQPIVPAVQAVPFHKKVLKELDELAVFMRRHGNIIPTSVYSQVRRIDDVLRPLISYIAINGCSPEQEHLLESMVTDYIPTPLKTFIGLPKQDRADDGRPAELLSEQFATIEKKVRDLAELVRTGALDELATHAEFLDSRFRG